MRLLPVVALGTAVALALGGAAYAATRKDDEPPLGEPPEDVCSSASDVGQATSEILADSTVGAQGLRAAAEVLRKWTTYCDDEAEQVGKASIALLEAKADQLEDPGIPAPNYPPGNRPPQAGGGGSLWPVPPGYVGHTATTGLHGDAGHVYWYPNGDQWFFPDNSLLVPYYIPGGSKDIIVTQGMPCGCGRCIRGEECGCGQ